MEHARLNARKQSMTQILGIRSRVTIILVLFAITVTAIGVAEGDEPASGEKSEQTALAQPPGISADPAKYDLRYQLSIGDVLRYEVMHSASIRSTIDETTQEAQTKTDSIKLWKVTDVLPNGAIEFMNVVERVHMLNQLPDHDPTEYDSERDESPPAGFEDAAKAVGVPLSVVRMTPRGEVVQRDVKFRHLNVDDDAPIVVRLPDEPVAVGATWDEPFEIQVELTDGTAKPVRTRRHHELAGVKNDIATIEVTYQILSPIDAPVEAQLVQRLMSGEAQFNIATGRLVRQQMEIDKRILGFAGPTSSLHYIMRMEEKAVDASQPKLADKATKRLSPPAQRIVGAETNGASSGPIVAPPAIQSPPRKVSKPRRPVRATSRPRSQGTKGYSR
jgi:hypothetical protein